MLGITMEGRNDILGVWIGEHKTSKFWLNVLNDLKSRGVKVVYLFCTDGLCGMMQAIEAVYPKSRLQRCIVRQIRSSTKYVSYKDIKKVITDLKKIYTAVTLQEAEDNLLQFSEIWQKQYPFCVKSWEENWDVLSTILNILRRFGKSYIRLYDEYYRRSGPAVPPDHQEQTLVYK